MVRMVVIYLKFFAIIRLNEKQKFWVFELFKIDLDQNYSYDPSISFSELEAYKACKL